FDRARAIQGGEDARRLPPGGGRSVVVSQCTQRYMMAESRLRVVRIQRQRALEGVCSFFDSTEAQEAGAPAEQRVHLVLAAIQSVRLRELLLAIELLECLADVVLREPDEGEKPVQAQRGVPIAAADLAVLHGRALTQNGFGLAQMSSGDVNHRHLEMRERKI